MSHAKNKVKWCLNKAEKELAEDKKHRGLVEIDSSLEKAKEHIEKAEHNIKTTLYLKKGGYTDWCSSTLFYATYHCFLAILSKHGYESRNQECTFALIASFIEDNKVTITNEELEKVSDLNHDGMPTMVDIREEYQYATKLSLKDSTLQEMLELAKLILHKTKLILEE